MWGGIVKKVEKVDLDKIYLPSECSKEILEVLLEESPLSRERIAKIINRHLSFVNRVKDAKASLSLKEVELLIKELEKHNDVEIINQIFEILKQLPQQILTSKEMITFIFAFFGLSLGPILSVGVVISVTLLYEFVKDAISTIQKKFKEKENEN